MKFRRLVVLVTSVAFVAGVQLSAHAGLLAASARVSGAPGPAVTPTPALGISGSVLRFDGISQVPNQRVQLRSVDKGTIVGKTVTDGSGAFSFAVTEPGLYVVEALSDDGGIAAVGNPVTLLSSPIVTNVVLQSSGRKTAWVLLAVAGGVGLVAWLISRDGTTSPEQ